IPADLQVFPAYFLARFLIQRGAMNENDFELAEPFDTDLESLDGIAPENAFALGVEWEMFRQKLKSGKPFTTLCLAANAKRLVKLAEHQGRFVEDRKTSWAGWMEIYVGDFSTWFGQPPPESA
ncbi:MAG: hypothetical protein ACREDS_12730, partial [Limisphaerales bacterium]